MWNWRRFCPSSNGGCADILDAFTGTNLVIFEQMRAGWANRQMQNESSDITTADYLAADVAEIWEEGAIAKPTSGELGISVVWPGLLIVGPLSWQELLRAIMPWNSLL